MRVERINDIGVITNMSDVDVKGDNLCPKANNSCGPGTIALTLVFIALFLKLVLPSGVSIGAEASLKDYYRGKILSFVVPYKAGGGYDAYARMLASALEKELGATVVVRNMPGGETYVALNHVYRAKPDGLTIAIVDAKVAVTNQLFEDPKAKGIDIRRFKWLARVADEPSVLAVSRKSNLSTIEDFKKKSVVKFGATGRGSREHLAAAAFIEALSLNNAHVILGFPGSSELALALMRGEVDGFASSASSIFEYSKQPEVVPFCQVASKRSEILPDVPTIGELVKLGAGGREAVNIVDLIMESGRSIVMPPDTPEDKVRFMRDKLDKILRDRNFQELAKKQGRPIDYVAGADLEKVIQKLLALPPGAKLRIKTILWEKYISK
ncbi:MAG: tripartite tricarboxylate transporter substrate binding protein [candidate division WOR-3 bacterium]